jgi:hypothetical protein
VTVFAIAQACEIRILAALNWTADPPSIGADKNRRRLIVVVTEAFDRARHNSAC